MEAGLPRPADVDLPVYRGDPITAVFRLYSTPDAGITKNYLDLSGYEGRAQIRREADGVLLVELAVAIADPQTGNNRGRFSVNGTAEQTAVLAPGVNVWDLELTPPGGQPRTWMAGAAPVEADVTR